jgi:hypothetical protein
MCRAGEATMATAAEDEALIRHQQRIDDMDDRISTMQLKGETRAGRLRDLHDRISGEFARLRRAFGDDWRRIGHDAQAGWRDLLKEMSSADAVAVGFHDEQVATFDEWLDSLSRELDEMHADEQASVERRLDVDAAGVAELRAQIAAARERRQALATAAPGERHAAADRYTASVRHIAADWQRIKTRA